MPHPTVAASPPDANQSGAIDMLHERIEAKQSCRSAGSVISQNLRPLHSESTMQNEEKSEYYTVRLQFLHEILQKSVLLMS
jgi:hypothetical protein